VFVCTAIPYGPTWASGSCEMVHLLFHQFSRMQTASYCPCHHLKQWSGHNHTPSCWKLHYYTITLVTILISFPIFYLLSHNSEEISAWSDILDNWSSCCKEPRESPYRWRNLSKLMCYITICEAVISSALQPRWSCCTNVRETAINTFTVCGII